jgi:hypothetical protein
MAYDIAPHSWRLARLESRLEGFKRRPHDGERAWPATFCQHLGGGADDEGGTTDVWSDGAVITQG